MKAGGQRGTRAPLTVFGCLISALTILLETCMQLGSGFDEDNESGRTIVPREHLPLLRIPGTTTF